MVKATSQIGTDCETEDGGGPNYRTQRRDRNRKVAMDRG